MPDDILQVRAPALCFYVLRGDDGLYVIDGGFVGGRALLRRAFRRRGWDQLPIRGILVTHGHLDHVLNVSRLAREFGAWIAAPRLDADHYLGRYPYEGPARVCGVLEAAGRAIFRYAPFAVDRWLDDGGEIAIWRGLTAVHLPGHTIGHMGFHCPGLRLLFSGDLFASYRWGAYPPPAILNSYPGLMPSSFDKALSLDLTGIRPNHCDRSPPEVHLQRLRRLRSKIGG